MLTHYLPGLLETLAGAYIQPQTTVMYPGKSPSGLTGVENGEQRASARRQGFKQTLSIAADTGIGKPGALIIRNSSG